MLYQVTGDRRCHTSGAHCAADRAPTGWVPQKKQKSACTTAKTMLNKNDQAICDANRSVLMASPAKNRTHFRASITRNPTAFKPDGIAAKDLNPALVTNNSRCLDVGHSVPSASPLSHFPHGKQTWQEKAEKMGALDSWSCSCTESFSAAGSSINMTTPPGFSTLNACMAAAPAVDMS